MMDKSQLSEGIKGVSFDIADSHKSTKVKEGIRKIRMTIKSQIKQTQEQFTVKPVGDDFWKTINSSTAMDELCSERFEKSNQVKRLEGLISNLQDSPQRNFVIDLLKACKAFDRAKIINERVSKQAEEQKEYIGVLKDYLCQQQQRHIMADAERRTELLNLTQKLNDQNEYISALKKHLCQQQQCQILAGAGRQAELSKMNQRFEEQEEYIDSLKHNLCQQQQSHILADAESRTKLADTHESLRTAILELEESRAECRGFKKELEEKKRENSALMDKILMREEEILKTKREAKTSLISSISNLNSKIEFFKNRIQEADRIKKDNLDLATRVENLKASSEKNSNEYKLAVEDLKAEHQSIVTQLKIEHESALDDVTLKRDVALAALDHIKKSRDDILGKVVNERDRARESLEAERKLCASHKEKVAEWEEKHTDLNARYEELVAAQSAKAKEEADDWKLWEQQKQAFRELESRLSSAPPAPAVQTSQLRTALQQQMYPRPPPEPLHTPHLFQCIQQRCTPCVGKVPTPDNQWRFTGMPTPSARSRIENKNKECVNENETTASFKGQSSIDPEDLV